MKRSGTGNVMCSGLDDDLMKDLQEVIFIARLTPRTLMLHQQDQYKASQAFISIDYYIIGKEEI